MPVNVDTISEAAKMSGFSQELRKIASVGDFDVTEAASKLQKRRPWDTIGQTAVMGGVAAPAISMGGKFVEGFVDTPGRLGARLSGGAKHVGATSAGEMAARSVTAGLGGGVIAAAKEGIDTHNARKTVRNYLDQHADKLANMLGISAPATGTGLPAPTAKVRSSSNKGQRVGVTPIAAKSGVTNSASGVAMNPRRSVGDAMTAFKA